MWSLLFSRTESLSLIVQHSRCIFKPSLQKVYYNMASIKETEKRLQMGRGEGSTNPFADADSIEALDARWFWNPTAQKLKCC